MTIRTRSRSGSRPAPAPGWLPALLALAICLAVPGRSAAAGWQWLSSIDAPGVERILVDGQTLFLATPTTPTGGSVAVYAHEGTGWHRVDTLLPVAAPPEAAFGRDIALAQGRLYVGAPGDQVDGRARQGAVYVYERDQDAWTNVARLVDPQGEAGDAFGAALVAHADDLAVGAPGFLLGGFVRHGKAMAWRWRDATWQGQALPGPVPGCTGVANGPGFGQTVALSADRLVVGMSDSYSDCGPLMHYLRESPDHPWVAMGRITAFPGPFLARLPVLLHDGRLLFGDPHHGTDGHEGTVGELLSPGGVDWQFGGYLPRRDPSPLERRGESLAASGDLLVAGAPYFFTAAGPSGRVVTWQRTGGVWSEAPGHLTAPAPTPSGEFGRVLAVDNGRLFVKDRDQVHEYAWTSPADPVFASGFDP